MVFDWVEGQDGNETDEGHDVDSDDCGVRHLGCERFHCFVDLGLVVEDVVRVASFDLLPDTAVEFLELAVELALAEIAT